MEHTIIKHVTATEQKEWDTLVSHPLQSWAWGEFRTSMGLPITRIGVYKQNRLTECWQMTFHPIPHTHFTIGYFPKGPNPSTIMIDELVKVAKHNNAIFIQLEPNILKSEYVALSTKHVEFVPSHHPLFTRFTFTLDLTQSEEQLLKNMHPKTRYNIKVAQKHGVKIQENNSLEAFSSYVSLSEETTRRQGFYAHTTEYQQKMWETLSKNDIAHLWTATYNESTVAAWILFYWKNTLYYPYGASSRNFRETMAPNLLLWEIAKYGKSHGFTSFDLWGALGPTPDEKDPWFGFHRFKQGYNPQLREYIGSFDLVINPYMYSLYKVTDKIRWQILKIIKNVKK